MKGITEKLIRKCMDEINEQDYKAKILEIYRDYYDKLPSGAAFQKRSKTITYLIGKGYEYEDILEMLD
jgi:regulatory protein